MDIPSAIKQIIREHNIHPRKVLGQNFLISSSVIKKEIELLSPKDKTILEIGVGPGLVTEAILEAGAKKVIGIEIDSTLAIVARQRLSNYTNFELLEGDALKIDFPKTDLIFSNVPYKISSPLLFKFIEKKAPPTLLCLQKEFVQRMVAQAGEKNYSRLSVMCTKYCNVTAGPVVQKTKFFPVPEVDSQIVQVIPKDMSGDLLFNKIVHALFLHKNKTVKNAFIDSRNFFFGDKKIMADIAETLLPDFKDRRVRTLTIDEINLIVDLCRQSLVYTIPHLS